MGGPAGIYHHNVPVEALCHGGKTYRSGVRLFCTLISKEGTAILLDHELTQMPVDVLAAQIHRHLHPGVTFCKEQAWQVIRNHSIYPVCTKVIVRPQELKHCKVVLYQLVQLVEPSY